MFRPNSSKNKWKQHKSISKSHNHETARPYTDLLVMGITSRSLIESEKLLQLSKGEMPFHILLLIYHTAAECLLVGLSLEDLFFNCSCLQGCKIVRCCTLGKLWEYLKILLARIWFSEFIRLALQATWDSWSEGGMVVPLFGIFPLNINPAQTEYDYKKDPKFDQM